LASYTIYTDGGCAYNPGGPGGYGVVMINDETGEKRKFSQGYISTTNNRMEIRGVLHAVKEMKPGDSAVIHTDSQYTVNCMTGAWKKQKNRDLWKEMESAAAGKKIEMKWVRGHNGDLYNEICDKMATEAMSSPGRIRDYGYTDTPEELKKPKENLQAKTGAMEVYISVPTSLNGMTPEEKDTEAYAEAYRVNPDAASKLISFFQKGDHSFRDYTNLKTFGFDEWSKRNAQQIAADMEHGDVKLVLAKEHFSDPKDVDSVMRWHARGLKLSDAIRKVLADAEVRANCY